MAKAEVSRIVVASPSNVQAELALSFFDYNFHSIHRSIHCPLAIAARITNHIWEWSDLFARSN